MRLAFMYLDNKEILCHNFFIFSRLSRGRNIVTGIRTNRIEIVIITNLPLPKQNKMNRGIQ